MQIFLWFSLSKMVSEGGDFNWPLTNVLWCCGSNDCHKSFNFIQIGSDHTVHHLGLSLLVAAQLQLTPFPWCIAIRENNVRGQPPKKCPLCTSLGILETGIYAWAFLYTVLQLTWKNKSKDETDLPHKYSWHGINFVKFWFLVLHSLQMTNPNVIGCAIE